MIKGTDLRLMNYGLQVTRATATLPATTTGGIFTVATGRVMVTSLIGLVTVAIQAQATTLKLVATPTVGAVNDLSATVDLNALAIGGLIGFTGLAADAAVKSTGGGVSSLRNAIAVAVGTIGITTGATSTGSISWSLTYVPLDTGAVVTAV